MSVNARLDALERLVMTTRTEFNERLDALAATVAAEHAQVGVALTDLRTTITALSDRIAELETGADLAPELAKVEAALKAVESIYTPPS